MGWDVLTQWVFTAGAVGTAAMGLIEAFKFTWLGVVGIKLTKRHLTPPAMKALERVYGAEAFEALLEGAWRKGEAEFERTLSTGLRLAVFSAEDIGKFAEAFGERDPKALVEAVELLRSGDSDSLPPEGVAVVEPRRMAEARHRLARLESVIDARVKAAVASGRDRYTHCLQLAAGALALSGCLIAALLIDTGALTIAEPASFTYARAIIVGILAVPLAPVAKDVVSFLNNLRDVFEKKKPTPA